MATREDIDIAIIAKDLTVAVINKLATRHLGEGTDYNEKLGQEAGKVFKTVLKQVREGIQEGQ